MENDQVQPNDTSLILLERFRDGDEFAAEALFSRYFDRLTALARSRLSVRLASRTDAEDIVMSVYRSFFMGARAGRFDISGGEISGGYWRRSQSTNCSDRSDTMEPAAGRSTSNCHSMSTETGGFRGDSRNPVRKRRSPWRMSWSGLCHNSIRSGDGFWSSGCKEPSSPKLAGTRDARNARFGASSLACAK